MPLTNSHGRDKNVTFFRKKIKKFSKKKTTARDYPDRCPISIGGELK